MKLQSLRMMGIIAMLFCAFKLGSIHQETEYLNRITACVKAPDNTSLQEFYGHGFKKENLANTIWNHAVAHNAHIYLQCIFKDLHRNRS